MDAFLSDQTYARIADAAPMSGNSVSLLKDAVENYPIWLQAIRKARRMICLESYFIREDEIGWEFAAALAAKAREGVRVRVIYDRLDLLVAANARRSLWLTDAYFVPTTPYAQALCAAAVSGVDVRLLIPGLSDVPFTRAMMRSGFRPLLEAGVKIYEWRGTMLHAKTAVADGYWSRVGSTNLNLTSWVGNWELDVAVEYQNFANVMERMYEEDLANATEIVLNARVKAAWRRGATSVTKGKANARPRTSIFLRVSRLIGMIVTNQLGLNPSEALLMAIAGFIGLAFVVIIALWPWVVAGPLVVVGGWVALALLARAYKLFSEGRRHAELLPASADEEAKPERVRNL